MTSPASTTEKALGWVARVVVAVALLIVGYFGAVAVAWSVRVDSLYTTIDGLESDLSVAEQEEAAAEARYRETAEALEAIHLDIIDRVEDKAQSQDYFVAYADAGQYLRECADYQDEHVDNIRLGIYTSSSLRAVGNDISRYCDSIVAYVRDLTAEEDTEIAENDERNAARDAENDDRDAPRDAGDGDGDADTEGEETDA